MSFRFRKFPIYKEIRNFIKNIYQLAGNLPKQEQYGLISQIKRAATSILLNLAEGSMKKSDAEFNRFLLISVSSVSEIVAILDICLDQKYIKPSTHKKYVLQCEAIAKQLYGFSRSLKKKSKFT